MNQLGYVCSRSHLPHKNNFSVFIHDLFNSVVYIYWWWNLRDLNGVYTHKHTYKYFIKPLEYISGGEKLVLRALNCNLIVVYSKAKRRIYVFISV